MYAQKMSVMSDQHDQALLKQQKDFMRETVEQTKNVLAELSSSVLSAGADLKSGWNEMLDQAFAQ